MVYLSYKYKLKSFTKTSHPLQKNTAFVITYGCQFNNELATVGYDERKVTFFKGSIAGDLSVKRHAILHKAIVGEVRYYRSTERLPLRLTDPES
ncbi:hypothetical protein SAMN05216167_1066 [Spirosoma endophyticum]|uniref:Uncharacterized protein n=1 Tax=Spirosoma endophyticum TaxID=662367 RepID=A0A1I1TUV8_9BACT|nr:hypothetical protein SAMN05216167_1066 [Spirosoma endophyticum]